MSSGNLRDLERLVRKLTLDEDCGQRHRGRRDR